MVDLVHVHVVKNSPVQKTLMQKVFTFIHIFPPDKIIELASSFCPSVDTVFVIPLLESILFKLASCKIENILAS